MGTEDQVARINDELAFFDEIFGTAVDHARVLAVETPDRALVFGDVVIPQELVRFCAVGPDLAEIFISQILVDAQIIRVLFGVKACQGRVEIVDEARRLVVRAAVEEIKFLQERRVAAR